MARNISCNIVDSSEHSTLTSQDSQVIEALANAIYWVINLILGRYKTHNAHLQNIYENIFNWF